MEIWLLMGAEGGNRSLQWCSLQWCGQCEDAPAPTASSCALLSGLKEMVNKEKKPEEKAMWCLLHGLGLYLLRVSVPPAMSATSWPYAVQVRAQRSAYLYTG